MPDYTQDILGPVRIRGGVGEDEVLVLENAAGTVLFRVRGSGADQIDVPVVASAAALTLPDGDVIIVSGTTSITSIVATNNNGRRVTLIFLSVLTVTDGSNLKIAGNFVTTADDTITLACDGTNWYEVARSVN